MDCGCERCLNFCNNKPGWFTPDQIELLARHLRIKVEELFQKYLAIDAVLIEQNGQSQSIYALAPAMVGKKSGVIRDPTTTGTCVWLRSGRCEIHALKPRECALVDHSTAPREGDMLRASILKTWLHYKKHVQNLYGKKLKPPDELKRTYRRIKRERALKPEP